MASQASDVEASAFAGAEMLAAALQAVVQPVWVVDACGLIRFANRAAVAALGYSDATELIGRGSHQTIHHHRPDGSPYPAEECPMLRPRLSGRSVTNDLDWFFRRDGSMFRVSYVSAPLDMADGRGAVVAFTDIEARLRAEEDLQERGARLAEQMAALRRVAVVVAQGSGPEAVFRSMADEVLTLLEADESAILRFEADGTVTVRGARAGRNAVGVRVELNPDYVIATVRDTGRPARFDTDDPTAPTMPEVVRAQGIRSGLASPIVVGGELWGAITIASLRRRLPAIADRRLAAYTELVASAISNAEAREDLHRLADEQAALRRVATLVASEASQAGVFTAIATEIGHVLGAQEIRMLRYEDDRTMIVVGSWGEQEQYFRVGFRLPLGGENAASRVFRTGLPARIEDYATASGPIAAAVRATPLRCTVAAPIVVLGRLWGCMITGTTRVEPLPPDTESRLGQFTELMATAIANSEARAEVERLAGEQASLRRVATLVAEEASLAEVFGRVAEEVASALGDVECTLIRADSDGMGTSVAFRGTAPELFPVGTRLPVDGGGVMAAVLRDGRPQRLADYAALTGPAAELARGFGIRSSVGCPILVGGRTWGVMVVARRGGDPFAPETETRIARFSDLVATAIANADARAKVERLVEEQAALRRVATLVAQGVPPGEIFSAVSEEVGRVVGGRGAVVRFAPDRPAIVFVGVGPDLEGRLAVGTSWEIDDSMASAQVYRTGRSGRIDALDWSSRAGPVAESARSLGTRATVASPITVEGRTWGAVIVSSDELLPVGGERRLEKFTELIATAIANAESRAALRQLAEEQAALRRVATLVARAAAPHEVFAAVTEEVGRVVGADYTAMSRYDRDGAGTVLGAWNRTGAAPIVPVGGRVALGGRNVATLVFETGRPARIDAYGDASGPVAEIAQQFGTRCSVGVPISVEGRLWGVMNILSTREEPLPADIEARLAGFTELAGTAIANAESQAQLTASRARIVATADQARRRIERDLHDGAQQRLVSLGLGLRTAQATAPPEPELQAQLDALADEARSALDDLRELARGIHPAILAEGGLPPALRALARRCPVPVELDVRVEGRLPEPVETAAYYVVSEALTNAAKHAQAGSVQVDAAVVEASGDPVLRVGVRDDGRGGADVTGGRGLVGLSDRVEALHGTITIDSPPGEGTALHATIPITGSWEGAEELRPQ